MTKARFTVDPILMRLVGRKLYKGHPLGIVTRELLQNAVDACFRAEVSPQITVSYRELPDDKIELFVDDNGEGMNEDVLVNKFLCLGGTTKTDGTTVGGLGIAKAAIVSCEHFTVETHDLFIDDEIVAAERDVVHTEWREGTRVTVVIQNWYSWDLDVALAYVFTSQLPNGVTVKVQRIGRKQDVVVNAGKHEGAIAPLGAGKDWIATGEMETGCMTFTLKGANILRLKGLTQVLDRYNAGRANNIFVDIYSEHSPADPEYPFTLSREELQGPIREEITGFINIHNANVVMSAAMTKDPVKPKERVRKGYLTRGIRPAITKGEDYVDPMTMGNIIGMVTAMAKMGGSERTIEEGSNNEPMIMIRKYKGSPDTAKWHTRIFKAWMACVILTASENEAFGFGLSGETYECASRYQTDYGVFYLINPNFYPLDNLDAVLLRLWHAACHETAHQLYDSHNEAHAEAEHHIARLSAATFFASMKQLRSLLK